MKELRTGASGGGDDVRTEGTRARILEAALEVLRDVGHGQFSVQKVARRAGVYQGNITYYWPRRRDLVLALALHVVEEYRRTFPVHLPTEATDAPTRARFLVGAMLEDAVRSDRVRLLPELWSIANGDPGVAAAITGCYDGVTEDLLIELGVPLDRPCADAVRSAVILAGITAQGFTAVHVHRAADDAALEGVRERLVALHADALAEALAACED